MSVSLSSQCTCPSFVWVKTYGLPSPSLTRSFPSLLSTWDKHSTQRSFSESSVMLVRNRTQLKPVSAKSKIILTWKHIKFIYLNFLFSMNLRGSVKIVPKTRRLVDRPRKSHRSLLSGVPFLPPSKSKCPRNVKLYRCDASDKFVCRSLPTVNYTWSQRRWREHVSFRRVFCYSWFYKRTLLRSKDFRYGFELGITQVPTTYFV